jgi:hypothetical protein
MKSQYRGKKKLLILICLLLLATILIFTKSVMIFHVENVWISRSLCVYLPPFPQFYLAYVHSRFLALVAGEFEVTPDGGLRLSRRGRIVF